MKIGLFKGKEISEMTRDELLVFATWASKRIEELQAIEQSTEDFRLDREMKALNP